MPGLDFMITSTNITTKDKTALKESLLQIKQFLTNKQTKLI